MIRSAGGIAVAIVFAAAGAVGCQDAVSPASALVSGEYGITDIAVDDFHVYFATRKGELKRVSLDGGAVETLASELPDPKYIALDKTDVFCATSTGLLARLPKDGGDLVELVQSANEPEGLAVDDTHLYFTVKGVNGPGAVRKVRKIDGSEAAELASSEQDPGALALYQGKLYWSVDTALRDMAVDGNAPLTFLADQSRPYSVAADSSYVYWTNIGDATVSRASLDGSDVRVIASEQSSTLQVAGDAANVYWSSADGTLSMAPVDGGAEPSIISSGPAAAVRLALDLTSIYWSNFEAGTVLVRPKP